MMDNEFSIHFVSPNRGSEEKYRRIQYRQRRHIQVYTLQDINNILLFIIENRTQLVHKKRNKIHI